MIKIANEASIIVSKRFQSLLIGLEHGLEYFKTFERFQETDFYLRSSLTPSPHHKSTINIYKLINFCSPGLFIPCHIVRTKNILFRMTKIQVLSYL